eukprot:scaffold14897_cov108-Isochrysis_galbana.AAC.3
MGAVGAASRATGRRKPAYTQSVQKPRVGRAAEACRRARGRRRGVDLEGRTAGPLCPCQLFLRATPAYSGPPGAV